MKKLIRNTSSVDTAAFWDGVKKSAELVRGAPAWKKAGVDLNERNFTTFAPAARSTTALSSSRIDRDGE